MIDPKRFWGFLEDLASITDPSRPYTRRSFSDTFLKGREYLQAKMAAAGLECRLDSTGNLIGLRRGKTDSVFAIGSHSDTVDDGGRFDGVAGVAAGLELAFALKDKDLNHGLCVIDYLAEEPSEWGLSCIGSRGLSGNLTADHLALKHPRTGESLRDALKRVGGSGDPKPFGALGLGKLAASFELHIEQGRVLEEEGIDLGVVRAIVGIARLKLNFSGVSNHAGTTPFYLRDDAFLKACAFALKADSKAKEIDSKNPHSYFVSTIGRVLLRPNAANVIPASCELIFDIRSDNDALIADFVGFVKEGAKADGASCEELSLTASTPCDPALMRILEGQASKLGFSAKVMPSGAGHDTAFMAKLAPACLLFVPSRGGLSHSKDEFTSLDQFSKGLEVLYHTILERDAYEENTKQG